MKFILFSLKQLALFQIYNFFLQTQTLEISKLHDGVGGVAGYINFQTKKFQIRLEEGGREDLAIILKKKRSSLRGIPGFGPL